MKKSKDQGSTYEIAVYAPSVDTYVGTIETYDEHSITLRYKKRRSPTFLRQIFPMDQVLAAGTGSEGEDYVIVKRDRMFIDSVVGVASMDGNLIKVTDEDGGEHIVNSVYAEAIAEVEGSGKTSKRQKLSSKSRDADEDDDEDEKPKKKITKSEDDDEDDDWSD